MSLLDKQLETLEEYMKEREKQFKTPQFALACQHALEKSGWTFPQSETPKTLPYPSIFFCKNKPLKK